MSSSMLAKREQLTSDISVLLARIKEIHNEEVLNRNDLRNNVLDKQRFSGKLGVLQEEQKRLLNQYESCLLIAKKDDMGSPRSSQSLGPHSPVHTISSLLKSPNDGTRLQEVSNKLTTVNKEILELEEAIHQLEVRVEDGIQSKCLALCS